MPVAESNAFAALRSDLLEGRLSGLDRHLTLLFEVEGRAVDLRDTAGLLALKAEAERNRELLAAAAAGVRAALRRLAEAGAPASVYAPDGRRLPIEGSEPAAGSRA